MSRFPLTFACLDYDRTRALQDGRIRPDGIDLNFLALPVEETFYRQLRHRELDASEMSLSSYLLTLNSEDPPFIAIPVFPSRYFRHQSIYVNANSGITTPQDLIGKRVGIPEYQMTASVWQRGTLAEHYGVPVESLKYFTGGLEEPGRTEKLPLSLPPSISVTAIQPDETLAEMLSAGQLDAIFCASEPSCFKEQSHIRRLFPDYKAVEQEYFRDTGIFPIMHIIVIRRSLHDREPWIAGSLMKAFEASLKVSYQDVRYRSALKTMLPWLAEHISETESVMGPDFWSYGLDTNRHVIEKFLEYSFDQGLAKKRWKPEEIFYAGASDRFRI
jgi:4,5-dihydroxyphthalate decarboxylase